MVVQNLSSEGRVFVNNRVIMTRRVGELTLNPARETIIYESNDLNCKMLYVSNHVFPPLLDGLSAA